jgi:hypothetical protein
VSFMPSTRQPARGIAETILSCSQDGAETGTVYHHAIDYDPVNNAFIFVTDPASGRRTWAYRFRNLDDSEGSRQRFTCPTPP